MLKKLSTILVIQTWTLRVKSELDLRMLPGYQWRSFCQMEIWLHSPHSPYQLQMGSRIRSVLIQTPTVQHCRHILYHLSHQGSPRILGWVAYPFSSRSSWPRNQTGVSCFAGRFFTSWAIREAPLTMQVWVNCLISSCLHLLIYKMGE